VKTLLSGNEAIARGAWEAGVAVASAYPGTPSTEILEQFSRMPNVYAEWATNEKVALDVAIGAAYAGRRALCTMKHVGLNVAADSFFYAAITGLEAGLVIVCADDPAMHSSQNEQDNRHYGKFARVPVVEPSDSQEAKDLVRAALDLSEQFDTPVMLRTTTRIAHSATPVDLGERIEQKPRIETYPRDPKKYVMIPAYARMRKPIVEERMVRLAEFAETFSFNRVEMGDHKLGIVTNGIAYQYAKEVFPTASVLKLGMTYPLPHKLIAEFASKVDRLIVLEELDPFIEEEIRLMGIAVEGKSIFSAYGEFDPRSVRDSAIAAGLLPESARVPVATVQSPALPARPPVLCPGCPHRSTMVALRKLKMSVNGDIGCYTLGTLPPLNAVHTSGCMGAGISQAHGADKAGMTPRNVAVIGDSTFFHAGMPALMNVAYNRGRSITVIMDNRITAMTGHQENPGTGTTLQGKPARKVEIEPLVKALGIDWVRTVDAFDLKQVEAALREAAQQDGPTCIITVGDCALLPEARKHYRPLRVNDERCNGCGLCFTVGCPALIKRADGKAEIDSLACTGCEICAQVCARKAILFRTQLDEAEGKR
jgi:indolepyruvate ferredoxin oxidoreductase, alpha subunit